MAQITLDVSSLTLRQRPFIKAAVSSLLHKQGITHTGIRVDLPAIEVRDPSGALTGLTSVAILDEINALLAALDAANAAEAQRLAAVQADLKANPLTALSLGDIPALMATITDLPAARTLLERLLRYLVASRDV